MKLPYDKYTSGDYLKDNPDWDRSDSPWKAKQVISMLRKHGVAPERVVEVGCGAGAVIAELAAELPSTSFVGYDIAPDASKFWSNYSSDRVSFYADDFLMADGSGYDLLLLLDVIEHVPDPLAFLSGLRSRADLFLLHIPLDLSALSVLREAPLLHVRNKVGHIHYFTKGLALQLMRDCGFAIIDWQYTGAGTSAPVQTWKTRLAIVPRLVARLFNRDAGIRFLGGETLIVLARPDLP